MTQEQIERMLSLLEGIDDNLHSIAFDLKGIYEAMPIPPNEEAEKNNE